MHIVDWGGGEFNLYFRVVGPYTLNYFKLSNVKCFPYGHIFKTYFNKNEFLMLMQHFLRNL